MNRMKQESPPSQKRPDETNGFDYHPSDATDTFLLEAIAKQVANSEIEAAKAIANIQAQIEELVMMFKTEAQKKTRAYTEKVNKMKAEHEAKAGLEEETIAYEKLLEKNDAEAIARDEFKVKVGPERQTRTDAEAKAEFHARTRAETEKKLRAQRQAKLEIEEKLKAEIQARYRAEQQAKAEAQERAKVETRVQIQAKVIADVQAQMEELAMMFRTEAQKKTIAYTDKANKIVSEHEEKTEPVEEARANEALLSENDAEVKDRIESQFKSETERRAKDDAEANRLIDKKVVKEMFYKQRLSWSQWLLRGIREDNITAVIVFCLLLYIVPSTLAISGYFVYTLLRTSL
jgi:hypothetical protein